MTTNTNRDPRCTSVELRTDRLAKIATNRGQIAILESPKGGRTTRLGFSMHQKTSESYGKAASESSKGSQKTCMKRRICRDGASRWHGKGFEPQETPNPQMGAHLRRLVAVRLNPNIYVSAVRFVGSVG